MKKQYIIIAAIVAGIAIASGFIITNLQNDYKTTAQNEHIFVPNLAQKINRLHEITFAFNSPTAKPISTTLKKVEDNNWIVKNKNYPADWAKLSKLLLSLSKSRFIEEKTNQPSRFNKLGLDADAALSLSLITKDKASIAFNLVLRNAEGFFVQPVYFVLVSIKVTGYEPCSVLLRQFNVGAVQRFGVFTQLERYACFIFCYKAEAKRSICI